MYHLSTPRWGVFARGSSISTVIQGREYCHEDEQNNRVLHTNAHIHILYMMIEVQSERGLALIYMQGSGDVAWGEDTRKGFTDHLYRALELAGIHTFRDDDEIQRGAEIAVELQKAIQESYVSLIVFSEDYASSRWCLDELAKIMKRNRDDGHMVLPVFYKVEPSHVGKQTETFGKAFAKLVEERFKDEIGKVEEWRRSLRDVSKLKGMVLGEQYEAQLIENIVEDIGDKLESKVLNVAPHAIGIDDRVKDINKWLRDGSTDVGVAGIYGMGGIGKTTIAKAAYNMNFANFQGSSFLADIRATSKHPNGLVRLQTQLLSDIQKRKPKKIYNVDEGKSRIKQFVRSKRVLIVLDDVEDSDQFSAILEMRESFGHGSKIIITTGNQHLLITNGISEMFMVEKLHEEESLELFSWHAFRQAHPIKSYTELSTAAVQHCGGLPLAIQVLGSSLFGLDVELWKEAIAKLDVFLDEKVQEVLRVSHYGTRLDPHDQSLFLHIACFFIGREKEFTITVLSNVEFYTRIGIQNLVNRCLVQVDRDRLIMHQLLIDMARGIVREESKDPGERSRVWQKDASDVLEKIYGTKTIEGLMLNLITTETTLSKTIFKSKNKRYHAEEYDGNCSTRHRPGFFSWISNNFSSRELDSYKANFKTEAFKKMHNLQLLLLSNVNFSGACDEFPKKLSWLSWQGLLWESIPKEFPLGNLVVLELQNSNLKFVWEGTKHLPKLKILDLSHSLGLVTTSDLSGLSNLERLILEGCTNISEIDDSIGELEKLVFLNVTDCKNLKKLPETIDRSVEPTGFSLVQLPHSLVSLNLAYCNLSEIFSDLSIFSSLKKLDLSGNPFASLPGNMKSHTALESLNLYSCTNLIMIPEDMSPPGSHSNILAHGNKIPNWYKYRGETAMSIIVPSHPKLKITGLNVCVVYTRRGKIEDICTSPIVKASNEAKGVMWSYCPVSVGLPKENEKMSWLSHWQFENNELECGEELRVSVDTDYMYVPILIKELAVQLVYEHKHEHDENEGKACNGMQLSDHDVGVATQHEAPYWSQGVLIEHVSAPKYQIWPGTYFFRNHHNVVYHIPVERPAGNMRIFEHHRFDEMRVLGQKNLL
ncbi:hypothetical protein ACLB2K_010821 [Fragaria x ananassa]